MRALIVWGGWDGHQPEQCANIAKTLLEKEGFSVDMSNDLNVFVDKDKMREIDLIIPVWTCGDINGDQANGMIEAVKSGRSGIAGWHGGMGDAFRSNTSYQFMVGGQFVEHPDGIIEYEVKIVESKKEDPIVRGINNFSIKSEQYYMHVDPANEVLATTTFSGENCDWIAGTIMPVVWKKRFGKGRVFYSSLGHVAKDFEIPEVLEITKRGMLWAAGRI